MAFIGIAGNDYIESHHKKLLLEQVPDTEILGKNLKKTREKTGAHSKACPLSSKIVYWYPTDFGDQTYSRIWQKACLQPQTLINLNKISPLDGGYACALQPEIMISGGCWDMDEFF